VEIKESFSFSSVHNGGSFIGFNNTMIVLDVIFKSVFSGGGIIFLVS
jgi:hypothetical protein